MNAKIVTTGLSSQIGGLLLVAALIGLLVSTLYAQDIRIKVLNGRNGKPVTNECLNVWLGPPPYLENLIAPTNSDGVVTLHLERNEIRSDTVSARACNGLATVGPKLLRDGARIAISGDHYVPCQEYGKPSRGETLKPSFEDTQIPSYSIKAILDSGRASSNTCGKVRALAKPGELIFFMRPMSFWEKMKL